MAVIGVPAVSLSLPARRGRHCIFDKEKTSPMLDQLHSQNTHTLVIFRVTEPIPDSVWDALPYGTKIPGDFREFEADDMLQRGVP